VDPDPVLHRLSETGLVETVDVAEGVDHDELGIDHDQLAQFPEVTVAWVQGLLQPLL